MENETKRKKKRKEKKRKKGKSLRGATMLIFPLIVSIPLPFSFPYKISPFAKCDYDSPGKKNGRPMVTRVCAGIFEIPRRGGSSLLLSLPSPLAISS